MIFPFSVVVAGRIGTRKASHDRGTLAPRPAEIRRVSLHGLREEHDERTKRERRTEATTFLKISLSQTSDTSQVALSREIVPRTYVDLNRRDGHLNQDEKKRDAVVNIPTRA